MFGFVSFRCNFSNKLIVTFWYSKLNFHVLTILSLLLRLFATYCILLVLFGRIGAEKMFSPFTLTNTHAGTMLWGRRFDHSKPQTPSLLIHFIVLPTKHMSSNWKLCLSLCSMRNSHPFDPNVRTQFFLASTIVPLLCSDRHRALSKIQSHNLHLHPPRTSWMMTMVMQYALHSTYLSCGSYVHWAICAMHAYMWQCEIKPTTIHGTSTNELVVHTRVQHTATTAAAAAVPSFNYSNELGRILK